ncbi:MAG TPA: glycine cleavage system aminomethyltransferase GcvT [Planctomycetota bacterium]|nr:glycine cleavage system aminomethyltransferase GcvT [Planctomycetota bacterium]
MKQTPFFALHQRHGAQLVDFAGYAMPVRYQDIVTEHHAVRKAAGMFDLCHMGRIRFRGRDATTLAQRVQTQNVAKQPVGRTRYALLCLEDGNILDDILISRETDGWLLVVNASNREADLAFFRRHAEGLDVQIVDDTDRVAMLAVQGPKAVDIVSDFGLPGCRDVGYYKFATLPHPGGDVLVSRTGYTGEDGFELFLEAPRAAATWDAVLEVGRSRGLIPCGLGCRDTLRLEAGMPLYGHEIDLNTNPFEARLDFGVSLENPSIAQAALISIRTRGVKRTLVGLLPEGKRIPRQGCPVLSGEKQVGTVCSGTLSPTLGRNIATAMIDAAYSSRDDLVVDIRGHRAPAPRTSLPFYVRPDRS